MYDTRREWREVRRDILALADGFVEDFNRTALGSEPHSLGNLRRTEIQSSILFFKYQAVETVTRRRVDIGERLTPVGRDPLARHC